MAPHVKVGPPSHQTRDAGIAKIPSSATSPSSNPVTKRRVFSPPVFPDGHRLQIPMAYLGVEPGRIWARSDNPVFNECGAAEIIGVSAGCLKKWRQRNQGPDYIQYGQNGPIRYELSALKAFRAANTVYVMSEP